LQKEAVASVVTKTVAQVRLGRFTILQLHRRHKMSDREPSQWQITLIIMENIREVQRRADSDGLRYIGVVAAFLVIRGAGASSLSILGLQINDTKLIQFALVPAAAFFAIRYAKAQILTQSLAQCLRRQLEKLPGVSRMICPPDWDVIRDIAHRLGRGDRFLSGGLELAMYALIVAGAVINLLDSTDRNRTWALLATGATALLLATTLPVMREWKTAVVVRDVL
jgi:hypothetical protein